MRQSLIVVLVLLCAALVPRPASALDKVNPYVCPDNKQGTGLECFLEGVPHTYTMCREIKSIEIIEFGLAGAQEGVNGAKTEYCIDKHKLTMTLPYQAALRESARSKELVERVRKLHDFWLESLGKLVPSPGEADASYKLRVTAPYAGFTEQIGAIRALAAETPKPAAPSSAKHKPTTP